MSDANSKLDFYFSFISLWSYIGSLEFQALVKRRNIAVTYKPINLIDTFAETGGKPVRERTTERQSYRLVEMQRWKAIRNIPLVTWPKFYPADPSLGHRMLIAALDGGSDVAAFVHAGLKAVWADELDIADGPTLVKLADASGLPGADLLAHAGDEKYCKREVELSTEALQRRVFGAPFYFYRDEPFWGQDRLELLEDAITSGRPAYVPPAEV